MFSGVSETMVYEWFVVVEKHDLARPCSMLNIPSFGTFLEIFEIFFLKIIENH